MCLAIPSKIVLLEKGKITVKQLGEEKEVQGSLIDLKVGDYVILQNNFIVRKIDKKSAEEIINLVKS